MTRAPGTHAPPTIPECEMASGRCPAAHYVSSDGPCRTCGGTNVIQFPKDFTPRDDDLIKESVRVGRSLGWIATSLDPPRSIASIMQRIEALGLDRPEPSSVVSIRVGGRKEPISVDDPAYSATPPEASPR